MLHLCIQVGVAATGKERTRDSEFNLGLYALSAKIGRVNGCTKATGGSDSGGNSKLRQRIAADKLNFICELIVKQGYIQFSPLGEPLLEAKVIAARTFSTNRFDPKLLDELLAARLLAQQVK